MFQGHEALRRHTVRYHITICLFFARTCALSRRVTFVGRRWRTRETPRRPTRRVANAPIETNDEKIIVTNGSFFSRIAKFAVDCLARALLTLVFPRRRDARASAARTFPSARLKSALQKITAAIRGRENDAPREFDPTRSASFRFPPQEISSRFSHHFIQEGFLSPLRPFMAFPSACSACFCTPPS